MNTKKKITLWILSVIAALLVFLFLEAIVTATFREALLKSLRQENKFGETEIWPTIMLYALIYSISSLFAFLAFYRIAPVAGKTVANYTFLFVGALGTLQIMIDVIQLGGISGIASIWCWEHALYKYDSLFGIFLGCLVSFLVQPKPTTAEISRYNPKA
jgi:hypothetical protein